MTAKDFIRTIAILASIHSEIKVSVKDSKGTTYETKRITSGPDGLTIEVEAYS